MRDSRRRIGNAHASAHRHLSQDPAAGARPSFAWHQLHWLAAQGVTEVVYSHRPSRRHDPALLGPRARLPFPRIRYVDEGEQLRGTGGALRLRANQGVLDESFFVIYGDSFLPVEFAPDLERVSNPAASPR